MVHLSTLAHGLLKLYRRSQEWCTLAYATCDSGENEPSWVSARRINIANCLFYQLPEELILQILGGLDDVSKAMAMRTCGLLMKIMFGSTLLSHPHEQKFWHDVEIWPPFEQPACSMGPKGIYKKRSLRKEIDLLLDRDRFCDPCRQFREDGRYERAIQALQERFWCFYCNKAHRRSLLSPKQRDASLKTHICVLAEGKAPFCAHRPIGWQSIQDTLTTRKQHCRHPDHDPPWYIRWENAITNHTSHGYERPRLRISTDSSQSFLELSLFSNTTITLFHLRHGALVTRTILQEHLKEMQMCWTLWSVHTPRPVTGNCYYLSALIFARASIAHDGSPTIVVHHSGAAAVTMQASQAHPHTLWIQHTICHEYRCVICDTGYTWKRYESTIYLEIITLSGSYDLRVPKESSDHSTYWLFNIDPESWGILNDKELRHVAGCDDLNCTSRWRWARLSKLLIGP